MGYERPFGAVADSHAEAEDVVPVFQREIEVVLAVLLLRVAVPQLSACPWYVADAEYHAVVGQFFLAAYHCLEVIGGEDVVVVHVEVVAVVVFGYS